MGVSCGVQRVFWMKTWRNCAVAVLSAATVLSAASSGLMAETMEAALIKAYQDNPQLNAQRALVRATDENVPQALSGYRPRVGVTTSSGVQRTALSEQSLNPNGSTGSATPIAQTLVPITYGMTASQILYNGLQNANRTRTAESQVMAAREALRIMEQNILLSAATSYMDVLRDTAGVQIQQTYVASLRQVLEQTKKRFSRGDVTTTDVSEAQAQLAGAEATLLAAGSNLSTSKARYEAVVGNAPQNLAPGAPVDRFIPNNLDAAINVALVQNPNVTASQYGVDVAYLQVKISEGALFPTVAVQASVQNAINSQLLIPEQFSASVIGQLSIPLYQGGGEYSLIRQSKENVGQQRLNLDFILRQVRQAVAQSWAQLEAAKGEVQKAKEQVTAAEAAVAGLLKEIRVGERTTLDLLIVQQNLVNARTLLITAQHDRVVASYNLVAAIGLLSAQVLGLPTPIYDPGVHYQQVRDAWIGIRIPNGQ